MKRIPEELKPKSFNKFDRTDIEVAIPERFERQVALFPESIALKDGDHQFTYREFNQLANIIAHRIYRLTGGKNEPITFLLDHGASQVIAILGILKAGHAYVSLDPSYPIERLKFFVSDTQTPLLVTDNKNLPLAVEISSPQHQIINLDDAPGGILTHNLKLPISPKSISSIFYSSGTTGEPKGCVKTHEASMHGVMGETNRRFFSHDDRFILLFSTSFAASASSLFGAILNGAGLYFYDLKKDGLLNLARYLRQERISIYYSVPSTFRAFVSILDDSVSFPDLRLIRLGGETVLEKDVDLFQRHFPSTCLLEVLLGGSEFYSIRSFLISTETQLQGGIVPVGYELEDKRVFIVDEDGFEVPPGEIGEIIVQSRYLSSGYWRQPELTAEKFAPVPGQNGMFQYRSGDLGRLDTNGCLFHLGRKDYQVKIRGHRIELAEITSALLSLSNIADAVVIAATDKVGENILVAYIMPVDKSKASAKIIRDNLSEVLPYFMIPTEFVFLDEIPKTPSGKVAVEALPKPEGTSQSSHSAPVEATNRIETELIRIWETLFDHQPISVHDDFFDLGGQSILALRMIAKIEEKFDKNLPFPALINARTIKKVSELLQDQDSLKSWSHMVALQPLGTKPPFFCVPPSAITVMIFNDLAKHMSKERPFYAFEYLGMHGKSEAHNDIVAMARFNIEKIRFLQPKGPYFLGGMCFGGLVAYEMAKQLLKAGEQVPFLGILDSTHAPYLSRPRAYPIFMFTRFLNQKILGKRFPIGMAPLKNAMKRFTPDDEFSYRVYDVFTTHNLARVKYVTTPYPGRITLFNTAGSRGDFSREQWKAVAGGGLEIVSIPGVHRGVQVGLQEGEHSFIHEPMVEVLAGKLNTHLDKV